MKLNKVTPEYSDFQKVLSTFKLIKITNDNIVSVLNDVRLFTEKYPKIKYTYDLRKNLLLRLRVSIEESTELNLAAHSIELGQHMSALQNSNFFKTDAEEEKSIMSLSYKMIALYLLEQHKNELNKMVSPNDIFTSALIPKICSLPVPHQSENQPTFSQKM